MRAHASVSHPRMVAHPKGKARHGRRPWPSRSPTIHLLAMQLCSCVPRCVPQTPARYASMLQSACGRSRWLESHQPYCTYAQPTHAACMRHASEYPIAPHGHGAVRDGANGVYACSAGSCSSVSACGFGAPPPETEARRAAPATPRCLPAPPPVPTVPWSSGGATRARPLRA